MKVEWLKTALLGCLAVLLVQCNQVDAQKTPWDALIPATDEAHKLDTQAAPVTPGQVNSMDDTQMTPSIRPPTDSGMQSLVEKAKDDLAKRLSISVTQIRLVEAKEVVWPDSSLGCPQEGMMYAQVLTDGYLVLLEANGQVYEYHTSRDKVVVHCKNPMPPISGTPMDQ